MENKALKDTAVVIPAYNEERSIAKLIDKILDSGYQIIAIDDGSADSTRKILQSYGRKIKLLSLDENSGKGNALRLGTEDAIKTGFKNIVVIDADGQHRPKDIARMIKGLEKADLVINYRQMTFQASLVSKVGRFVLRSIFNVLFGTQIRDHISGFRVFRSSVYPKIKWRSNDYRVEIEMLSRAVVNKVSTVEIATPCNKRMYQGMGWGSGMSILCYVIYAAACKSRLRVRQ